ncbi:MAG: hypothetical protein HY033_09615 [Ignavibacteriae bacterium]|nr:hypothetical protein [Ignavibacteriota bacterium]
MKQLFLVAVMVCMYPISLHAGDDKVNVLGYYAVTNSLDGQPMIDMVNVLRFYPVFAMRDSVDKVNVTIYYGGNIFERDANRMDDGKYWQALLPIFHLGEAIQRFEVEVHFELDNSYRTQLKKTQLMINSLDESLEKEIQNELKQQIRSTDAQLETLGIAYPHLRVMRKSLQRSEGAYKITRDSIFQRILRIPRERRLVEDYIRDSLKIQSGSIADTKSYLEALAEISKTQTIDTERVDKLIRGYLDLGTKYITNYKNFEPRIQERTILEARIDSIRDRLKKEIEAGLTDTSYSGISIRKSDVKIDNNFDGARILYRNYKQALRHLMALDPAERLGIFRVRYIPFPITRTPDQQTVSLRGPFGNQFTVFEVGLAFGDAIVSGDDFVVPEFSWQRLGVAFAITEKLFSDSAQVIALALTYDFNSYGSIGIGGNFAQHETNPYVSFGINKKAFEAVLSGLSKLFK